jgi:hypothetical protein
MLATGVWAQIGELQRAVEEFRVLTRELGYREGQTPRSGAGGAKRAQFHGRVFENLRNDILDAVPHELTQNGATKDLLRRNQFGFNVSGPVMIPHLFPAGRATFFSLSYEGVRERISRSYLRTVPIESERTGDYSRVVDSAGAPLMIYDPASLRSNPAYDASQAVSASNLQYVKDTFPASAIPATRQDRVARAMLDYYPHPNSAVGPYWKNNFFIVSPETNQANGVIAKVDHSFLGKHRVSVSYSVTNGLTGSAKYINSAADSAPADRTYQNRRVSLEHVYTLSPQSVNTFTVEGQADISENAADSAGWPSKLGLAGVAGGSFPYVSLGAYVPMGRGSPVARNARNTYVFTDALGHKRGPHNLRFTSQFVRYQVNTFMPGVASGAFGFGANLTSLPGITNTGLAFASFLLGGAESADYTIIPSPSYFRNWSWINAAQDTWEVRPGLTFSFGLNMLASAPRSERYNRQSMVDFRLTNPENGRKGALAFAGRDGQGSRFQPAVLKPQPNASMAWNPGGNRSSVLRLSYGMSYQSYLIYNGQWGTRGYSGHPYYYSANSQLAPALTLGTGVPAPETGTPNLTSTAGNDTTAAVLDGSGRLPRYQSVGASYEREVPGAFVVTASLGVAWGRDLFVASSAARLNAVHPDNLKYGVALDDTAFNRSLRPYPQYLELDVYSQWPDGRYRREAGSLRVEKRTAQGLSLSATYEYSRQYDDYSGPVAKQDMFNRANEWALSAWNNPHRLSLSYMYELPFGANKPYFNFPDWRRYLADGWAVSGISSVNSGLPLALRSEFNNTGGVLSTVRVNVIPGVEQQAAEQGPDAWFNRAAFVAPDDFELGSGPRTHPFLRGPISQNHDLAVTKRIPIDQERSMEFTASGFNFLNHANWTDPDVSIGTAASPNTNAGCITGSHGGRVVQLGLRFSF